MNAVVRHVEIFSAGCVACEDTDTLEKQLTGPSCEVTVLDINDQPASSRAITLGIRTIPTMGVDGQLAECRNEGGPSDRL